MTLATELAALKRSLKRLLWLVSIAIVISIVGFGILIFRNMTNEMIVAIAAPLFMIACVLMAAGFAYSARRPGKKL